MKELASEFSKVGLVRIFTCGYDRPRHHDQQQHWSKLEPLTLRDSEKGQKGDGVAMGTPHCIMNIAERNVERVIVVLASCDRDGGFVTSEDNWHKHCTMCPFIFGNCVLEEKSAM